MSQEGSNSFNLNVSEVCNSENIHILNVKWYFTIKDILLTINDSIMTRKFKQVYVSLCSKACT
jgi:hypothetical protein